MLKAENSSLQKRLSDAENQKTVAETKQSEVKL
jgi:hypothetical protein